MIINIIEARGGAWLVTTNVLGWVYWLDGRDYVGHFGKRRVILRRGGGGKRDFEKKTPQGAGLWVNLPYVGRYVPLGKSGA